MYTKMEKKVYKKVKTNTMASSDLEFTRDIQIRTLLSDKAFADRRSYNPILAKMHIHNSRS